jgi:hypothetical protein
MKRARLRTESRHSDIIAAALVPDNTEEMETQVDGDVIETTVTRETTGGLRATVDDYVVNLSVAERIVRTATERTGITDQHTDDTQS